MRNVFWVTLVAMTGVYLTMLLWSLPYLSTLAGGLPMFDMRPGGYSFEEARAILVAIGVEGKGFYLSTQQRLDTAYPALMAAVLSMSFFWLYPKWIAGALSALAIVAAGFDYLENAAVAVMLHAGQEGLVETMVTTANRWTQLKSGLVTIAMIALLIGLALAGWRKWRKTG